MVLFDEFSCNKFSFCLRRMSLTSFNLLTLQKMSLGDFSSVESFNDRFSIKTCSTIKDCITITLTFNKFTLSLFKRQIMVYVRLFQKYNWRFTNKFATVLSIKDKSC